MAFLALLLSFCAVPSSFLLLRFLNEISEPFHHSCLFAFQSTAHFSINAALFCGENIEDPRLRQLLVGSGIYHLVVVAGIHLHFIEKILRKMLPKYFHFLIPYSLGIYALICAWHPPVVRAWIQSSLRQKTSSRLNTILSSWIFCLALHPQWIHSLSLHLSIMASLAFLTPSPSRMSQNLKVFAFHFPLLIGWTSLHPVIPLLGYFLMPFGLILWFSTGVIEFFYSRDFSGWNFLLEFWEKILVEANALHPVFEQINFSTNQWAWAVVALTLIYCHTWHLTFAQKQEGF